MIKFLLNAISNGLAFSKTEARGTLVLILLIIISLVSYSYLTNELKSQEVDEFNQAQLVQWVAEVESSYAKKKVEKKEKFKEFKLDNEPSVNLYRPTKSKEKETIVEIKILDLNTANAIDLQAVKGIGKVYSERIVKYRNLLGGFTNANQLKEVYGITDTLVTRIKDRFEIQSDVMPFEINSDSAKVLASHPYISYDLAWIIVNYRKQNGDIESVNDLMKIKAIDDSLLQKLRPYLK